MASPVKPIKPMPGTSTARISDKTMPLRRSGRLARLQAFARALRPHHWAKNLIIFVPLVTSHRLGNLELTLNAFWAFAAFNLCSSAVYLLNDLIDLDSDRQHATKKLRPFASGDLPPVVGMATFPILVSVSALLAWKLPWGYSAVLATYLVLTTAYSWWLKRMPLVDVFCLAALYSIRLVAGQEATGIVCSFWLLAFSVFIFLSLALVKRFMELKSSRQLNRTHIKDRGYVAADDGVVSMLGASSGYISALVLALYVNSPEVRLLYQQPTLLLLICPLLLYWISRVWLIAHRGEMHEDPIVFALRDKASYCVAAIALGCVWLATGR